jgi:hypothetical protein
MKKTNSLFLFAAMIFVMRSAQATTVIPPSFDELVTQAEVIFQGNVTEVKSQWIGEGGQRHIVSYVTFQVEEALKGSPGEKYTIRMFGGTVDGESMAVGDAPKFAVGDRDILFVENNGSQIIPLVGIMHGRFHVRRDQSGQEVVTDNEGVPLKNVARLGKLDASAPSAAEANVTAANFKAAVKNKLQKPQ